MRFLAFLELKIAAASPAADGLGGPSSVISADLDRLDGQDRCEAPHTHDVLLLSSNLGTAPCAEIVRDRRLMKNVAHCGVGDARCLSSDHICHLIVDLPSMGAPYCGSFPFSVCHSLAVSKRGPTWITDNHISLTLPLSYELIEPDRLPYSHTDHPAILVLGWNLDSSLSFSVSYSPSTPQALRHSVGSQDLQSSILCCLYIRRLHFEGRLL